MLFRQTLKQSSSLGVAVFVVLMVAGVVSTAVYNRPAPAIAGLVVGLYFLLAIKVAEQWQRAAVLRLGRYIGLRGPGIFMIIPIIDQVSQYSRASTMKMRQIASGTVEVVGNQ